MHKRYKIKEEMAINAGGVGEYSTPKAFKKYRIKEIKINQPIRKARITSGDENEIIVYKDKVKYQNNPQEIEKALQQQGVRDIFGDDLNNTYWALIRFIGDEGEVLPEEYWWDQNEINYNINELNENHLPEPKDFPIKVSDYYQGQMIGGWLQKHGYKINLNDLPFDINPVEKPYYIYDNGDKTIDWSEQLSEIKINKPNPSPQEVMELFSKRKFKGDDADKFFEQLVKKYNGKFKSGIELFKLMEQPELNKLSNLINNSPINEIKINNPTTKLILGQYYDFLKYGDQVAEEEYDKFRRFCSLEKVNGKPVLWELGYKYIGDEEFEGHTYNQFLDPWDGEEIGYGIDSIQEWFSEGLIRRGKKQEGSLNESKYSQFKQSTTKPNPKQVLHKAIKEIQLKLDEVNKLIDFTSRIKGELTEGDQEIEYLKRTKDNINKIQNRLKEVFNKLCELDEIKVNNPIKIFKPGDKVKTEDGEVFIVGRVVGDRIYIYYEGHYGNQVWVKKEDLEKIK